MQLGKTSRYANTSIARTYQRTAKWPRRRDIWERARAAAAEAKGLRGILSHAGVNNVVAVRSFAETLSDKCTIDAGEKISRFRPALMYSRYLPGADVKRSCRYWEDVLVRMNITEPPSWEIGGDFYLFSTRSIQYSAGELFFSPCHY